MSGGHAGARRRVFGVLAGLALLSGVAACGGGARTNSGMPDGRPLTTAQLRARLLPERMANGWTSQPYAERHDGGVTPDDAAHCRLLFGEDVLFSATSRAVSGASADLSGGMGGDDTRLGGEEGLYSFRADGAQQALAAVRATVAHCPRTTLSAGSPADNAETTTFAVGPGPRFGDESLALRVTVAYRAHPGLVQHADAFLVRFGTTLMIVDAPVPTYAEQDDALAAVVPLAVAQFTAARPQPVDPVSIQL